MKPTLLLTILLFATLLVFGCASQDVPEVTPGNDQQEATPQEETPSDDADAQETIQEPAPTPAEDAAVDEQAASGSDEGGDVVTFVLTGENYRFLMGGEENPTLRVNKGDTVRIEFTSASGFHDWATEFGSTERVRDGESTFVEFVADQTGTFDYYCSVGSHRQLGMEGQLIVE